MKILLATLITGLMVACTDAPVPRTPSPPTPTPTPSVHASAPALESTRISVPVQPATLLFDHGSLWVGGSLLVRLEDDRIVQRLRTGVSRVGMVRVGGRLWATGGGDGGVPDGSVVAFDVESGERVERRVFPGRSPYGIDAGTKGIFVALFQGDLLRITPPFSSVPLTDGLTQVLVAHGKVWVSSPQRGKVWRVEFHGVDDTGAAATELKLHTRRSCPQGLESSADAIWVADPCARRVWLLDPGSGEVANVLEGVGRKPVDVDISERFVWIVSFRDDVVSVVDVDTLALLGRGQAGDGAIAIAAKGRDAWVANHEDNSLTHFKLR